MDEGKETRGEFIIAGSDSEELLEFEEESFHEMAFLVKPPIDIPWIDFAIPGRDAEIRVMVSNKFAKRPFAISLVRENGRAFQANSAEQFFSNRNIVNVGGGQRDLNRVAQGIDDGVDLRASAAAAHTNALIGLSPVLTDSYLLGGGFLSVYGF